MAVEEENSASLISLEQVHTGTTLAVECSGSSLEGGGLGNKVVEDHQSSPKKTLVNAREAEKDQLFEQYTKLPLVVEVYYATQSDEEEDGFIFEHGCLDPLPYRELFQVQAPGGGGQGGLVSKRFIRGKVMGKYRRGRGFIFQKKIH